MIRLFLFACAFPFTVAALADFGTTSRVSMRASGQQLTLGVTDVVLNANGRYSAFSTSDPNVVSGDLNGASDVFLRDNITGTVKRVSVSSNGGEANGESHSPSLSSGARHIVFVSTASNLVAHDTNGVADIFMHDTETGRTVRVNVPHRFAEPNGPSFDPVISGTGRIVAFRSDASNLAIDDNNGVSDIFSWDTRTGLVTLVSRSRFTQAVGNGPSWSPSIDLSGSLIAFSSVATNFELADTNECEDVFLSYHGTVGRVSHQGNGRSFDPYVSPDGKHFAYATDATNLYQGDVNGVTDLILFDLTVFTSQRIRITPQGTEPNGDSYSPKLSLTGGFVAFVSEASNLVGSDANKIADVFVRDFPSGVTVLASKSSAGSRTSSPISCLSISGSGSVGFVSPDSSLVPMDTNGTRDAFVHDPLRVRPSAFEIGRGTLLRGNLLSTIYSDDSDFLSISRGSSSYGTGQPPVVVTLSSTVPRGIITGTSFNCNARASVDGISQSVEFFDYASQDFVPVAVNALGLTFATTTKNFAFADANRFVSSEGEVRVRLSFKAQGQEPILAWSISIDQMVWKTHE